MEPIIEVKGIGKKYNITHQQGGYIALRDVLAGVLKSPFRALKTRVKKAAGFIKKEEFWALRGLDFNVVPGEVVGIIGHNGAGKSTLLKILTGITPPTEGEIIMRGKVASLLEVGTGFHPELTGRENIFLNGAILGMTRKEIARNFDRIVDFAGITKFLDTPVKYYSSGMYVRLAFSVAAHLEPDILLVDEVLAVGDAEFQKKCLGKMEEITSKSGRTILFVSHNMDAIQQLCPRTILLSQGKVQMIGPTEDVIAEYLKHSDAPSIVVPTKLTREFKILKIESKNRGSNPWMFNYKQPFEFEVEIESYMDIPLFQLGIVINSFTAGRIASVHNESRSLSKGRYRIAISVDNIFTPGTYSFTLDVIGMYYLPEFATFYINNDDGEGNPHDFNNPGMVSIGSTFTITTLKN